MRTRECKNLLVGERAKRWCSRRMKIVSFVLLIAACGGSNSNPGGTDASGGADAQVFNDAPPSVPAMITIGGTAYDSGQNNSTPLAGVAITLKSRSDDST